jgi:hypothetical protein
MKRIIIIGEGQTEQAFCFDVLMPFFSTLGIYIQNPTIKKTAGGIVRWEALKHQIETTLKQDTTAIVTTLIDYYGLYSNHQYPGWVEAKKLSHPSERVAFLELSMKTSIDSEYQDRFEPYIQLHEFEGILFSEPAVIKRQLTLISPSASKELEQIIQEFPNPEDINNNRETAPSKRLGRLIPGYEKVIYGSLMAQEIGLDKIRQSCPRFNAWISRLESI